jgi:hypothetical protein
MAEAEAEALAVDAQRFADEIVDLLDGTICSGDAPITAEAVGNRVRVAAVDEKGDSLGMPLHIAGEHRLDLHILYWCTWDFTGRFLAIHESKFALALPGVKEPLVRVEYEGRRDYAPSHVQLHAQSNYLGYLLTLKPRRRKLPEVWHLHLPTGGKRYRPCLEDLVEFAVHDLGVDVKAGWEDLVEEGRARFRGYQLAAVIRDAIKADPDEAPDYLKRLIDEAHADIVKKLPPS